MEQTKECIQCKLEKPVNVFFGKGSRNGKQYYDNKCKECRGFLKKPQLPDLMDGEIWVSVVNYEGKYEVSNLGRFKSVRRRIRSGVIMPQIISYGSGKEGQYKRFMLADDTGHKHIKRIHQLVAVAFIENSDIENKTQVNHIDGNKSNNHYLNLEWCTPKENREHAVKTGLHKIYRKIPIETVKKIRASTLNNKELSKMFGIDYRYIWSIRKNIARTHIDNL